MQMTDVEKIVTYCQYLMSRRLNFDIWIPWIHLLKVEPILKPLLQQTENLP